ncbi:hypothetical protein V8G54_026592 [Vigna mungo]|uniref:Uncharacterized protein n=1 Tax=Vigna mungo TaxID=3915 RepID=A0AAQ3N0S7_VIGMU
MLEFTKKYVLNSIHVRVHFFKQHSIHKKFREKLNLTFAASMNISFVSGRKRKDINKQEKKKKADKFRKLFTPIGVLPLECLMNLRSASLRAGSELSPVQSSKWEDSQSASAHDMLQVLTTPSEEIISYFKTQNVHNRYHSNHKLRKAITWEIF